MTDAKKELLLDQGYRFWSAMPCPRCNRLVEFWKRPWGKLTPFEVDGDPHSLRCPYNHVRAEKREVT